MQTLTVKNFLTLPDITLEVNKINLIIGPNAQGKSLLAKLVYYFKTFSGKYCQACMSGEDFDSDRKNLFTEIFPAYAWQDSEFTIAYTFTPENTVTITNQADKLTLGYSSAEFKDWGVKTKEKNRLLKQERERMPESPYNAPTPYFEAFLKECRSLFGKENEQAVLFIPANRSFFAQMQANMWRLAARKISIEYFLREFGSFYEKLKDDLKGFEQEHFRIWDQYLSGLGETLLDGTYAYDGKQEGIDTRRQKIWVQDTSSGQQEVLPVVLHFLTITINTGVSGFMEPYFTFVEEPEAHLFPTSQQKIVEFFSEIYNTQIYNDSVWLGSMYKKSSGELYTYRTGGPYLKQPNEPKSDSDIYSQQFFITTHSPYILTAFNNLIQAQNTFTAIAESDRPESEKQALYAELNNIVPDDRRLPFEHVSAYSLADGKLTDIMDYENRLIHAYKIDDVSDELSKIFGKLVDLEFSENNEGEFRNEWPNGSNETPFRHVSDGNNAENGRSEGK